MYKYEDVTFATCEQMDEAFTSAELMDIYNALTPDKPVKKWENRQAAVRRTWQRIEETGDACPFKVKAKPEKAQKPEKAPREKKPKAEKTPKAEKAPREKKPKAPKEPKAPREKKGPEHYGTEPIPTDRALGRLFSIVYNVLKRKSGATVSEAHSALVENGSHACKARALSMLLRLGGKTTGERNGEPVYTTENTYQTKKEERA